jgi:hypothetical protein
MATYFQTFEFLECKLRAEGGHGHGSHSICEEADLSLVYVVS